MSNDPHVKDWQGRPSESIILSKRLALASFGLALAILTALAIKQILK